MKSISVLRIKPFILSILKSWLLDSFTILRVSLVIQRPLDFDISKQFGLYIKFLMLFLVLLQHVNVMSMDYQVITF